MSDPITPAQPIPLRVWLRREQIGAVAELIDKRPDKLMADMPDGSRHWRVILGRRQPTGQYHQMTVYFSQGPAIEREPSAEDVLDCLASDYSGFDNARSFEDWCGEYGYDTDSRKAEATYRAVQQQAEKLERFLTRELAQQLAYGVERP